MFIISEFLGVSHPGMAQLGLRAQSISWADNALDRAAAISRLSSGETYLQTHSAYDWQAPTYDERFPAGAVPCWPEASLGSPLQGPLCRAAHIIEAGFYTKQQAREQEREEEAVAVL